MSGGVGPVGSDITIPKEQEGIHKEHQDPNHHHSLKIHKIKSTFLSFPQLNSLAVIIILASSGMVSLEDFSFLIFSFIYLFFISKIAFPVKPNFSYPPVFDRKNKILRLYVHIGAIIGLYAPIAYILVGTYEGDKEGIKAASPHLLLLASQIFMEGVAFTGKFSPPSRAFVPVLYNSRRIFTIVDWLRTEMYKAQAQDSGGGSDMRVMVGRVLAVANMMFWCYNLFGFLLPVYLPKVFKMYYSGNKEKE
ncbi:hypothetical protein QN277_000060 [Acacia crassicarpa]|uniref:DUF7733 domain-containing protein n=1 Tax=Acacia crassicarpa TaxID=499986 RepID=A0AAE1N5C1_9FABA|nr:hypothetical protein QN277_000060 [Acacia crassicarpa]